MFREIRRRLFCSRRSAPSTCRLFAAAGALLWLCGDARAAITISPTSLPDWTVNVSYSQALTASGCLVLCTWSSHGTLPPGLSLSTTSGLISGTPATPGTFGFTVTATDETQSKTQPYTITIHPPPAIVTPSLPDGTVGAPYSQTISVSNGTPPYSFSITSGALPAGLTLDAAGVISGMPSGVGSSGFTIGATDQAGAIASQGYLLNIVGAPVTITSNSPLPGGVVGTPYSQMLAASGGAPPYSWSVSAGALPSGISLNPNGQLSGTPTAAGTSTFTAQVVDTNRTKATKNFTITIDSGGQPLSITTSSPLPPGTTGAPYSQTLAATGGTPPYSWSVSAGALPAGISLNPSSGVLAGTPTASGTFDFTAQVSDSASGRATKQLTVSIAPGTPPLTITTASPLPSGTLGVSYSQTVSATGGRPPYTWLITTGALPTGLALSGATGTISGTPAIAGSFTFNIHVTDSASSSADQLTSIAVVIGTGPALTLTGVPANANSAAQVPFDVTLASPYVRTVSGQVVLTFQPATRDDPAIQFSTGGRTVNFTIPAGSTHATFPAGSIGFQTGTVAGMIQLTVSSDLPGGTPSASTAVASAAPVIRSATVAMNSSGFQVQVAGYSNSRDLAGASFHFTAKSGQNLQTGDLTVNLASLAAQWYSGDSSTAFGGQFLLMVPFTVQEGAASDLASVSVQLQNAQGTSTGVGANF